MTDQIPTGALAYLATPYSLRNLRRAHVEACAIAGTLMRAGIHVICPIAHTHHIAFYGGIDRLDHKFWLEQNQPMLERCDVLIVACLDGFAKSKGIAHEVDTFIKVGKPIFDLDPSSPSLTMSKRKRAKPRRDRYDGTPASELAKLTNDYLETDQPIPARASESHQGIAPACDSQGGSAGGDFS